MTMLPPKVRALLLGWGRKRLPSMLDADVARIVAKSKTKPLTRGDVSTLEWYLDNESIELVIQGGAA